MVVGPSWSLRLQLSISVCGALTFLALGASSFKGAALAAAVFGCVARSCMCATLESLHAPLTFTIESHTRRNTNADTHMNRYGMSSIYPLGMSWPGEAGFSMDTSTTATLVIGGCVGEAVVPLIIGACIFTQHMAWPAIMPSCMGVVRSNLLHTAQQTNLNQNQPNHAQAG